LPIGPATARPGGLSKKDILKPDPRRQWVIPKASGAFGTNMEEVLDVYTRPSNFDYPLVCLDENSKPMIAENARAHPDEKRATREI
jgi:hypothetical protein